MTTALIALLTALILDVLFGELPNRFHPVAWMGRFIHWMTVHLNRGSAMFQFFTGSGMLFLGELLFSIPFLFVSHGIQSFPDFLSGILIGVLLKPMFACRGLLRAGREVQQALINEDILEARRLVGWYLVSRDTGQLTMPQVASAVIESLSENFTDSFFAPLLFFSIGGLPAVWFYRFVNTADAMVGYHTPQFEYFGKCAARVDDLLNWLPARLAGVIITVSAALLRMDVKAAWSVMVSQHNRTSSPNAGWTMSAAAGALQVLLEKPGYYSLGNDSELPSAPDIGRAMRVVKVAAMISVFVYLSVFVAKRLFL
ncbi:MAG: cobalamin biosynthesis protein [Anaerolineales bacterium]|nr:cobalamin biosynthesis protein [Anaerolineales bacterium]